MHSAVPQRCAYVVRKATVENRERNLNATCRNEFEFPSGLLTVDMLSDSRTTAMTNYQRTTVMLSNRGL